MNVNETENMNQPEIRHSLARDNRLILVSKHTVPKQPTARMKIINRRPFYYEVVNEWDPVAQRCRQKSKYLGKTLPPGYRLTK